MSDQIWLLIFIFVIFYFDKTIKNSIFEKKIIYEKY